MTNWPTKKLGEVLDYEQPGKYIVKSKNYSSDYKTPVLTAGKTFILGNTDEKENIFPAEKLPVIIFDDFTTAIKFVDFPFKIKSSAMKILHSKKDIADIKYLFYLMQTIEFSHITHKRYWISEYSQIKILLPPIGEQKRIVEKIEKLFAKIDEASRLREESSASAAALLPSALHQIFMKQHTNKLENVGISLAKWKEKELGEVATLVRGPFGGSLRKDILVDSGDCVYEQGNVIDGNLEDFRYFITPEKFAQMRRFSVAAGDILMSCSGTIGKFVIIPEKFKKGVINQALLKITPSPKITSEFLKFKLDNYFSSNQLHIKGMAIKNIAAVKELKKIKISLPPVAEQKEIVAHLDALSAKTRELQTIQRQTAADFSALQQAVLAQAFA